MLVLKLKANESVRIGDGIRVKLVRVGRGSVRLGFEAERSVPIVRETLLRKSGGGKAA